ncbi:MAG: DivIVA domain-containing protein [Micrococcus sp.]|nr:DivIVA domain-containing protein [Micrococcus sp.]
MALSWEDIVNKQFRITKFAEGYLREEVDDYLDDVAEELRRLTAENESLRQQLAEAESRGAASPALPQTQAQPAVSQDSAAAPSVADTSSSAAGVLAMAQRLHDEFVAEGEQKRAEYLAEGEQKRAAFLSEGETQAARLVAQAETKAEKLVTEAEEKRARTLTQLEKDRAGLEVRVNELRDFETEYRSSLKSYIQGQLRDLEGQQRVEHARPDAARDSQ